MRIENYLNVTQEEVESKQHNFWIGISLGNKYFTKENIKAYIYWALRYAKSDVLVVIGDLIHAINLEVLDSRSPEAALRKALELGDVKFAEVKQIIDELKPEEQAKVKLARWRDILHSNYYQENLAIVLAEYKNNPEFRDCIREIVREGRKDRTETIAKLSEERLDRLVEYILNELPHFINGVQGYAGGEVYTVLPYPGLSKLDYLFVDIQNKRRFRELANKLHITNKIGVLEAYVD